MYLDQVIQVIIIIIKMLKCISVMKQKSFIRRVSAPLEIPVICKQLVEMFSLGLTRTGILSMILYWQREPASTNHLLARSTAYTPTTLSLISTPDEDNNFRNWKL